MTDSAFAQLCLVWHGSLIVSGCHVRGTVPIDAVVAGPELRGRCDSMRSFRCGSDHDALGAVFHVNREIGHAMQERRFALHRKRRTEEVALEGERLAWESVGLSPDAWLRVLEPESLDVAWSAWSTAAEQYLVESGVLAEKAGDALLGSAPEVRLGGCPA